MERENSFYPYVTSLNILAAKEMWGKEAALEYVRQLSKQVVGLIRCNEIERVASGEFSPFVMDCSGSRLLRPKLTALRGTRYPVDGAMLRHRMLTVPGTPNIRTPPSFSPHSC